MKEDMIALAELVRELGEKYDAYITVFTFNGESSNLDCIPKDGPNVSEFIKK